MRPNAVSEKQALACVTGGAGTLYSPAARGEKGVIGGNSRRVKAGFSYPAGCFRSDIAYHLSQNLACSLI